MARTLTPPAKTTAKPDRVVTLVDGIVPALLVALGLWTVLFHIALNLDLTRNTTFVVWLISCGVAAVLFATLRERARPWTPTDVPTPFVPAVALAGLGLAIAAGLSHWILTGRSWVVPWLAVVLLGAGGLYLIWRVKDDWTPVASLAPPSRRVVAGVVVLALGLAFASAITNRPDLDDAYLVNRSTYIENHSGPFPERDTIFSDEVFANQRPPTPQTSYEALIGTIAAFLPWSAADITYLGAGPLASALSALAAFGLARALQAPRPGLVALGTAAFVALDGASHASFGNLHFGRAWQAKVVFLIVVVPALWTYALAWSRQRRYRDLAVLTAGGVAAVGLTTSSTFIVPTLIVVGVAAGALATRNGAVMLGALVAILYPIGAGLSRELSDPQPLLAFVNINDLLVSDIDPGDQIYLVFGHGYALFLPVAAMLVAWLTVRDLSSRLALLLAPLAVFVLFLTPGVLDYLDQVAPSEAVLWRVLWIIPVPVAVGLALTWRPALGVLLLAGLLVFGTPVMSGDNNASVGWPALDLPQPDRAAAERVLELTPQGGNVAVPQHMGAVVAVLSSDVRATLPRPEFATGRHVVDEFRAEDRVLLTDGLTAGIAPEQRDAFAAALVGLDIQSACQFAGNSSVAAQAFVDAGYQRVDVDDVCTYWVRDQ